MAEKKVMGRPRAFSEPMEDVHILLPRDVIEKIRADAAEKQMKISQYLREIVLEAYRPPRSNGLARYKQKTKQKA